MTEQLRDAGVDTSISHGSTLKTGATTRPSNPPSKHCLNLSRPMRDLVLEDIDWDFIASGHHLHLGCFFLQTGIRAEVWKLFSRARELGLTTSLDTNWDPDEEWGEDLQRALEHTDLFLPNDDEAMRIAGTKNLKEAMEHLGDKVTTLVVKRGGEGAIARKGAMMWLPPRQVKVVETTGAGDSFNAVSSFIFAEEALPNCLEYGKCCGALAGQELGGTGAFRDPAACRPI